MNFIITYIFGAILLMGSIAGCAYYSDTNNNQKAMVLNLSVDTLPQKAKK
jgi:hypothetical protein